MRRGICILFSLVMIACGDISQAQVTEHLMYDRDLKKLVPKYKEFGGNSFSVVVFDKTINLHQLALENLSHLKSDSSNIEYDLEFGAYRIYRSKHSWTVSFLEKADDVYEPIEHLASCRKSFGTGDTICTFKYNLGSKGYQFALDSANLSLSKEILRAIPTLIDEDRRN